MSSFLDKFIADTYHGVLHSDLDISVSGLSEIFDGDGNQSSLSLGRVNNGAKITGTLNSTNVTVDQTLTSVVIDADRIGVGRLNALDVNTLALSANNIITQNLKAGNVTYPTSLTDISLFSLLYPIGSIYLNIVDVNPGTFFNGTTWIKRSEGRFLVGVGVGVDQNGNSRGFGVGNNNGEYTHTITTNEMPSHTHTGKTIINANGGSYGGEFNTLLGTQVIRHEDSGHTNATPTVGGSGNNISGGKNNGEVILNATGGNAAHNISGNNISGGKNNGEVILNATGGNAAHNITPPSFGVFVWERTS